MKAMVNLMGGDANTSGFCLLTNVCQVPLDLEGDGQSIQTLLSSPDVEALTGITANQLMEAHEFGLTLEKDLQEALHGLDVVCFLKRYDAGQHGNREGPGLRFPAGKVYKVTDMPTVTSAPKIMPGGIEALEENVSGDSSVNSLQQPKVVDKGVLEKTNVAPSLAHADKSGDHTGPNRNEGESSVVPCTPTPDKSEGKRKLNTMEDVTAPAALLQKKNKPGVAKSEVVRQLAVDDNGKPPSGTEDLESVQPTVDPKNLVRVKQEYNPKA